MLARGATTTTPQRSTAAIAAAVTTTASHDAGRSARAAGGVALLFAGIKSTTSGTLLDAFGPEVAEGAPGPAP
jgi:hypothetical protein